MRRMMSLAEGIRAQARDAGFDFVGVAPARPAPDAERFSEWLGQGMHGTMTWMEDPQGHRRDPRRALPWSRSLVLVGLGYCTGDLPSPDPSHGAISRYAWGRDYHRQVRTRLAVLQTAIGRLAPGCRTMPFVDTSPMLEKGHAEAAGLGWRGKHTNLLRKRYGSWFFLGGLATDLELEADLPARDHCGTCTRCIDVCPTRAIVAPYVLDARLCIAYLTIENRGPIPVELRPAIGNRIFGCDDCQEVCPWNKFAVRTSVEGFEPRIGNLNPLLPGLFALTQGQWNRRFGPTPVRRAHYDGFLRNVAVALGNWGTAEAAAALRTRLDTPSPLVREHVAWALEQCGRAAAAVPPAREQDG
jgi:epoxyqueuosine reductase